MAHRRVQRWQRRRLISRSGRDHTLLARTLILDGEVCAFDANLVSHIYLLDTRPDELATPPVLMAFDCLYERGRDLCNRPLVYRRDTLEDSVVGSRLISAARRLHPHGLDAWAEVKQRHEGRFVVVGLDVPIAGTCSLLLAVRVGQNSSTSAESSGACSRRIVAELRERVLVRAIQMLR